MSPKEVIEGITRVEWKLDKFNKHEDYDQETEPSVAQVRNFYLRMQKGSGLSGKELQKKMLTTGLKASEVQEWIK